MLSPANVSILSLTGESQRGDEAVLHGSPKIQRTLAMNSPQNEPTTKWAPVILILFSSFVLGMTWMVMLSFFTTYSEDNKDISLTAVGFIYSTQEITTSIVVPFTAWFSKQGFLIGQFVMAAGQLGIVFANSFTGKYFLYSCEGARVISGLGSAFLQTGTLAWICKLISNKHRGLVFGLWKTFSGLGMVAGPVVGVILYQSLGFDWPYLMCAASLCFVGVAAAPFLFSELCCKDKNGEIEDAKSESETEGTQSEASKLLKKATWGRTLAIPSVTICGFLQIWQIMTFMYIDPTLSDYMKDAFGSTDSAIAVVFAIYYGAFSVLAPFAGWFGGWFGNIRTILLGVPLVSFGLLMLDTELNLRLSFLTDESNVVLALIILSLGSSFSGVPVSSYIVWAAESVYPDASDIAVGIYTFTYSVGSATGPLVGSAIVEYCGFSQTSLLFGCLLGGAWVLVLIAFVSGIVRDDYKPKEIDELAEAILKSETNFS